MTFARKISRSALEKCPQTLKFAAGQSERLALAARFDLLELKVFKGEATATLEKAAAASAGPGVMVQVHFKAKLSQRCGITLEPVPDVLCVDFRVRFVDGPLEETDLDGESDEDIEPLNGEEIDIGEITAQYLGTAINPYPRKKGAEAGDLTCARGKVISGEKARELANPFSLLKKLWDRN